MTKFIYAMSLFLLAAISIKAQPIQKTSSCLLHGSVVSSTDATAIAGATVRLYQLKKLVGGTVSDASGNFNVKCPSSGSLQLRITAVGFKEVDTTLNVPTVTPIYIHASWETHHGRSHSDGFGEARYDQYDRHRTNGNGAFAALFIC